MSLPEPINWLHMSEAEYIYLVSTGPPEQGVKTDRDFWQNFSEPSDKGMVPVNRERFWNFNNWEFFTNEQKAIERAKEICWPDNVIVDVGLNLQEKGVGPTTVEMRRKLSIKQPYPTTGVEIIHKWGVMNPDTNKWTRQTYVVRVKTNVPKTEGFRNWRNDSGPHTHSYER
jgi:hypothetical protein